MNSTYSRGQARPLCWLFMRLCSTLKNARFCGREYISFLCSDNDTKPLHPVNMKKRENALVLPKKHLYNRSVKILVQSPACTKTNLGWRWRRNVGEFWLPLRPQHLKANSCRAGSRISLTSGGTVQIANITSPLTPLLPAPSLKGLQSTLRKPSKQLKSWGTQEEAACTEGTPCAGPGAVAQGHP